jgi:hypothetical protein
VQSAAVPALWRDHVFNGTTFAFRDPPNLLLSFLLSPGSGLIEISKRIGIMNAFKDGCTIGCASQKLTIRLAGPGVHANLAQVL